MAKAIIGAFLGFVQATINLVFGPIYALIDALLNQLGLQTPLGIFNSVFYDYVYPAVCFFIEFIPPHTLEVICLELIVTIIFWTVMYTLHQKNRILGLIKKLPFM